jgi:16S rRNA (cytosine967-C5)-methyltransferase
VTERERALNLLQRIEREALFASALLQNETGTVRTLVLGVLRWRSRLDHAIRAVSGRSVGRIDSIVLDILRLGAYQLLFMDVATYAAVDETVDLASHRAKRARGFVNAVLRRIAEGKAPDPDDVPSRTAHPPWLIERWTRAFGGERAAAIATANQELSYPDVLVREGDPPPESTPSSLVPSIARMQGSTAALDRARFYPMDEGSAVVAWIAAAAGDDVLDLAAAPGGKTLYLRTRDRRVVSNDISIARLRPLAGLHKQIVVSDGRRPPFARQFQVVLVDAPCSATGTIRKNPELKWRVREEDIAAFATLQRELLESAVSLARETVVYATCSLEPEENDAVVADVLSRHSEFAIHDARAFLPDSVLPWVNEKVLRLTPESGTDGFTAFVLRRRTPVSPRA